MELQPEMILLDQEYATKEEAIRASGQLLVEAGCVEPEYVDASKFQLASTLVKMIPKTLRWFYLELRGSVTSI